MTRLCVLKTKEACILGPSRFGGNCTKKDTGKKTSGNNETEGEQREILMFTKEVEDLSTEDQA